MADIERIIREYQESRNMAAVARDHGLSRERVRQLLHRAGVDTSVPPAAPKKPTGTWGGARPGSGPKPKPGGPLPKITVTIAPADVRFLHEYGDGNASEGVRRVVELVRSTLVNPVTLGE